MQIQRGFKVKIYPSEAQGQELLRVVGACRWIYNYFLDRKKTAYLETHENLTYRMLSKEMTQLRKNIEWLGEVQHQPLQQALRSLDVAYNCFYRKQCRFPGFKSRYDRQSFREASYWSVKGNRILIMKGMSVRFRGQFAPYRQGTLTISRDRAGSWYAAAQGYEERSQPHLQGAIGIDLGLKDLVVTSDGEKFGNIRSLDGFAVRIKSAQQNLSRKKKGSINRAKAKLIVALAYQGS